MMYTVGQGVAVELEMGIAKYITNYLNSIVNYKFGNLYIYYNRYNLYILYIQYNYDSLHNHKLNYN